MGAIRRNVQLSADTPESRSPRVLDVLDALLEGCRVVDCAHARTSESADPQVEALMRFLPHCRAVIARGGQAIDVINRRPRLPGPGRRGPTMYSCAPTRYSACWIAATVAAQGSVISSLARSPM
jgi:hypothetical protein